MGNHFKGLSPIAPIDFGATHALYMGNANERGITSVKVFADSPLGRIAEILGRNEEFAKELLGEAKRLLKS